MKRPSALYGVTPPYVAFCFDRAVDLYGRSLEDALRRRGEGHKTAKLAEGAVRRELDRWLAAADVPEVRAEARGRFRDPFAAVDVTRVAG